MIRCSRSGFDIVSSHHGGQITGDGDEKNDLGGR